MEAIPIPTATANRLTALLQEKQRAQEKIDLIIQVAGEALDVPSGWVLKDLSVGFESVAENTDPLAPSA